MINKPFVSLNPFSLKSIVLLMQSCCYQYIFYLTFDNIDNIDIKKQMETNLNPVLHCRSIDNFINPSTQPPSPQTNSHSTLTPKTQFRNKKNMIQPTNFNFQSVNQKINKTIDIARIHSKMTTKRVGGQVVLVSRKQKNRQAKENKCSKNKRLGKGESGRETFRSCRNSDEIDPTSLQIKSYQNDRESNISESDGFSHKRHFSDQLQETFSGNNQVVELFKEVKRKMESQKQSTRVFKKKKDCFFVNLKKRLQEQVKKVSDQTQINKMSLLIEGCQAHQHAKTEGHNRSSSERPKTARKNMNLTDRTCSARPASSKSSLEAKIFQQVKRRSAEILNPTKERHTTRTRPSTGRQKYIQNNFSTLTARSPTQKQSHLQSPYQKLNDIIQTCNQESTFNDVKVNMKTFQYYCKRMQQGFSKAGRKIEEVQCMQID